MTTTAERNALERANQSSVDAPGESALIDLAEYVDASPWVGDYAAFNMMVYGEPGEGKTPLLASVVDVPEMLPALLVDIDGGTLSARDKDDLPTIHLPQLASRLFKNSKIARPSEWLALETIYAWLLLGTHPYKTVMLDGGTDLMRFCELECIYFGAKRKMEEYGKDHDPELAELADYRRIYERTKRTYVRFRDLMTKDGIKMNFVATAHEDRDKDTLEFKPLFIGKSASIIMGVFDILARMTHNEAGVKCLVPCLEGRVRGRDRSNSLGRLVEEPTMKKITMEIFGGERGNS